MNKEERLKDYLEGYNSQYQFIGEDKIEHSLDNDIKELLQENKQLKEQVDRLIKKEYEKDNDYIVKVRTGKQLEREQYLLNFKSKSMMANMLIDAEERIDKAIEYCECHFKTMVADEEAQEVIEILKGEE